jgi:hypothetical protein
MKARIASMASFAGVLVAGSAAAMVNSQVLHNASMQKNSVQNVAPLTIASAAASSTASPGEPVETVVVKPVAGTEPASSAEGTEPADHSGPATSVVRPAVITQARYKIGDAGDVLLDTAGDHLTIVSNSATGGWKVSTAGNADPLNAVVTFQSATRRVVFHASLLFGVVNYSTTTYDLVGGGPVTTEGHNTTPTVAPTTAVTTPVVTMPAVTTPAVTTVPSPTTTHPHDRQPPPRPGTTTTEPRHQHHPSDPGAPSTTTPRWGSGNGEDD